MSLREVDVAKLYEDLVAFDRYLELLEPNADASSPPSEPTSGRPGSRPPSVVEPPSGGTELVGPAGQTSLDVGEKDGSRKLSDVGQPLEIKKTYERADLQLKQQVCRVVQSTLGQMLLLVVYSFFGATLLYFTESYEESRNSQQLKEVKRSIIADLFGVTRNESVDVPEGSDLWKAVEDLLTNYTDAKDSLKPYAQSPGWTYWGALFYCGTVYTTVGYGNVYPITTEGRIITIIYALVGIPLCLVVLMNLGKAFTHAAKYLWSFVRRFYYTGSLRRVRCMVPAGRLRMTLFQRFKYSIRQQSRRLRRRTGAFRRRHEVTPEEPMEAIANEETEFIPYEIDDSFNLPPIVALMIAFVYMLFGSLLYTSWEKEWSYFDAFYFVFISFSTIGLGDIVPQHPKFFLLTAFYPLIGLALVAMVINVCMEQMNMSISKATDRVLSSNLIRSRIAGITAAVRKIVEHLQETNPPPGSPRFDPTASKKITRRGSV